MKANMSPQCKVRMKNYADFLEMVDKNFDVNADIVEMSHQVIGDIKASKRFGDGILEVVINGMLSGAMTPIANAVSLAAQKVMLPTREAMGVLTDAIGITQGGRDFRDVVAMVEAMMEGGIADMHYLRAGWDYGYPLDTDITLRQYAASRGKSVSEVKKTIQEELFNKYVAELEKRQGRTLSAEERQALKNTGEVKRIFKMDDDALRAYFEDDYDYMRNAIRGPVGEFVRWPTRVNVALDEYAKARFRRMKVAQLASRKAREDSEQGLGSYQELFDKYRREVGGSFREETAQADLEALSKRMGQVFGQNAEDMAPYQSAKEFAQANTFQSALTGFPRVAQQYQKKSVVINYMVPFIKTPWNILKEGTSYIPGLGAVARPQYLTVGKDGVAKIEKLSKDEVIPRQMLGASMMLMVGSLWADDRITGAPRDGNEAMEWRAKGIQPFSIKVGDTWISYQRIEPLATPFGIAADLFRGMEDMMTDKDMTKEEGEKLNDVLSDLSTGFKNHIFQKSFFEGFNNLLSIINTPGQSLEKVQAAVLSPLVPAAVNMGARLMDPEERIATSPMETLQRRVPGLREQLAPDFDPLDPEGRKTSVFQAITGFKVTDEEDLSPVQREAARVNAGVGRIRDQLKGVPLTSEQTSEFRRLYSQFLDPVLTRVMNGEYYQRQSDARKKVLLEKASADVKREVGKRFYGQLWQTDKEMAKKFYNKYMIKQGFPERQR